MCGIVAFVSTKTQIDVLAQGLRRLSKRRYDSAGLAVVQRGKLQLHKRVGSVESLLTALPAGLKGFSGMAHTRWASDGEVSENNAHPQPDPSGRIALVHNGLIENVAELRAWLHEHHGLDVSTPDTDEPEGLDSSDSDSDSAVLAQLIGVLYQDDLLDAVAQALSRVVGTLGLVVMAKDQPKALVAASRGSPLYVSQDEHTVYLASESEALISGAAASLRLGDDQLAWVTPEGYRVFEQSAWRSEQRPQAQPPVSSLLGADDGFRHAMHREIHEQPRVLARALQGRLDHRFQTARLDGLNLSPEALRGVARIKLLACGSAHYAALYGAQVIEGLARIPCSAESAAEFSYRHPVIESDTLYVVVSQSGETFDTWQAVQEIQRKGATVIGMVNAVGSRIARACQGGMYLHAGQEHAVPSTKSFTAMLLSFVLFGLHLGRMRDLSPSAGRALVFALASLPEQVESALPELEAEVLSLVAPFTKAEHAYFVGRGLMYPLAMEGALKLKEVSYIHAESYSVAALKHGPVAMLSPQLPCVMLLPQDDCHALNLKSLQRLRACESPLIGFVQREDDRPRFDQSVLIPTLHPLLDGVLMSVAMQLFAYHVGVARDCEIDQPRHLAKSLKS